MSDQDDNQVDEQPMFNDDNLLIYNYLSLVDYYLLYVNSLKFSMVTLAVPFPCFFIYIEKLLKHIFQW